MKKTGDKWQTEKCGRCGDAHSGYSGKLDADGVEYVVCGITHKRMNVLPGGRLVDRAAYPTVWIKEAA